MKIREFFHCDLASTRFTHFFEKSWRKANNSCFIIWKGLQNSSKIIFSGISSSNHLPLICYTSSCSEDNLCHWPNSSKTIQFFTTLILRPFWLLSVSSFWSFCFTSSFPLYSFSLSSITRLCIFSFCLSCVFTPNRSVKESAKSLHPFRPPSPFGTITDLTKDFSQAEIFRNSSLLIFDFSTHTFLAKLLCTADFPLTWLLEQKAISLSLNHAADPK